jgi:hypothetical protein
MDSISSCPSSNGVPRREGIREIFHTSCLLLGPDPVQRNQRFRRQSTLLEGVKVQGFHVLVLFIKLPCWKEGSSHSKLC